MIIVTGGAGLIGSALVWGLNQRGDTDILIVDEIDHDEKEHNIAPLRYERLVGIQEFREMVREGLLDSEGAQAVLHMGACSNTTEEDWDYLADNNVAYTQELIRWCSDRGVRCIYASSAAVYGDGNRGFSDDHDMFDVLEPLNLYGKSKLEVDVWARDAGHLGDVVGLRYFNVFGPNEWHKEGMRSVALKKWEQFKKEGKIELFKSENDDYADGEQERDFVYIKDAVKATLHFLDNPEEMGVYNIGTGNAQTWKAMAGGIFTALGAEPKIEYIDLPVELKEQYQYHTQADISKLRESGYTESFTELREAVEDYASHYLEPHRHLGE